MKKELRARKAILLLFILIIGLTVFGVVLYPEKASSGPFLNSTHGNSSYGVNRASISAFGYPKGHCTHCHEQHASIGGSEPAPDSTPDADNFLLFWDNYTSQTENVCLKCHVNTGSVQVGESITNHSYSFRAGRLSPDFLSPADIKQAFTYCYSGCGDTTTGSSSSHNLGNIQDFIKVRWNYTADSNPCTGCHNPHMVIGDPAGTDYWSSSKTDGTRGYSPVSRPSLHSKVTSDWGLWGDVTAERMDVKASSLGGAYQAPLNGSSTYEPDGSSTQDGSNLTDFVTFCTDCHANDNISTSHNLFDPATGNVGRYTLFKIDWTKELHGQVAAFQGLLLLSCNPVPSVYLLADPYACGTNYVLSCTDCHEPHGSPNNVLARPRVNNGFNDCVSSPPDVVCDSEATKVKVTYYGTANGPDGRANKEWVYLCGKCHTYLNKDSQHTHPKDVDGLPGTSDCLYCHLGGGNDYRNCGECHYHGSTYGKSFDFAIGDDTPLF
ncbi:MAG: hypothetical protein OEW04_06120 [Nitrospirota bacterium]|nr:hypothetical protein [Nitrospirota bacterium]